MKSHKNLWKKLTSFSNLLKAWRKARLGKTQKVYVKEFEKDIIGELFKLQSELENQNYSPQLMKTFILRDPKTRKISKSHFRDRIIHHAICNIIEPIFDKTFIFDNCANRKGKGGLFALNQFNKYWRKVTNNLTSKGYCLKADIKHYFQNIEHEVLLNIIKRKINDKKLERLIQVVLGREAKSLDDSKGIPLGNLTSQFFANVYLNELDQFAKHKLKSKYYIRYVDDFILLHSSKEQLREWKKEIIIFLNEKLKLELHPDKSKIINLSRGIDFVGFRNFYYYRLLRKRNIMNIQRKIDDFHKCKISKEKFEEIWQGWSAYAIWSNCYSLKKKLAKSFK